MIGVDLHTHSNVSDGELSPVELLHHAKQQNIQMLALTDHDSLDGNLLAAECAVDLAIRFIHGVEISSYWQRANAAKTHAVHIVALNMQNLAPMQQLLLRQQQLRAARASLICEKLQAILKTDFLPEVLALADGHLHRISRTHIAKVLFKQGVVSRLQQAFDRFLKEGRPAYVAFNGASMDEVLAVIKASQGVSVLAHPSKYNLSATNVRELIARFASAGGDAVELPAANEPPATRQMVDREIALHGLKVSVGSDFHGLHMPWRRLGAVPTAKANQYGIWQDF